MNMNEKEESREDSEISSQVLEVNVLKNGKERQKKVISIPNLTL